MYKMNQDIIPALQVTVSEKKYDTYTNQKEKSDILADRSSELGVVSSS